jgi:uncharacterized membrane protein
MENTNTGLKVVPKPSIGSAYGHGWDQMKKYFLYVFLITILLGILMAPMGVEEYYQEGHIRVVTNIIYQVFATAYFFFVLAVIQYGSDFVFLKMARDEAFEIREVFDGFKNYLNIILANILVVALIGFGIVLLIIPGIIIACRLALVPYIVMDKKLDPIKAVEESWKMTKGYGWTIFGMALICIPIFIGGLILVGVGVIISFMWIHMAFASIYYAIDTERSMGMDNGEKVAVA